MSCCTIQSECYRVRQTPEGVRRTYRPKRCGNNNKDEDISLKTLNDKNQQASSQKFSQLRRNKVGNVWVNLQGVCTAKS